MFPAVMLKKIYCCLNVSGNFTVEPRVDGARWKLERNLTIAGKQFYKNSE